MRITRRKDPPARPAAGLALDVDALCLSFARRCREHGVRVTTQRLAVYRALAEDPSHPTADAIHRRLRGTMPSLSPATVYRVLEDGPRVRPAFGPRQLGADRVASVEYLKFPVGAGSPSGSGSTCRSSRRRRR
jgi:hypothetical protein